MPEANGKPFPSELQDYTHLTAGGETFVINGWSYTLSPDRSYCTDLSTGRTHWLNPPALAPARAGRAQANANAGSASNSQDGPDVQRVLQYYYRYEASIRPGATIEVDGFTLKVNSDKTKIRHGRHTINIPTKASSSSNRAKGSSSSKPKPKPKRKRSPGADGSDRKGKGYAHSARTS